jgi:hypothetical protein
MSKEAKEKTGTREWADNNVNIQIGCENGCRYCYARWGAVVWHKYCEANEWNEPRINHQKVDMNYGYMEGGVMIPSTHDITPLNISEVLVVINKLLAVGNEVLIVSKPRWSCIPLICESLKTNHPDKYKSKVTFRFTIGSTDDNILKFWEPNAPPFKERWACLKYAYEAGFNTSVSCEPYLDQFPDYVYVATEDYVTDKIWVGLLRDWTNRVERQNEDITHKQIKQFVLPLYALQNPLIVKAMYKSMKDLPKIAWKDSIRKVIARAAKK